MLLQDQSSYAKSELLPMMMQNQHLTWKINMVSKILIDTNVLLDYLLEREPFFEDAKKVISSCTEGNTKGCIAAHSISNMFFILRKDYTAKESTLKNTLLTDYISAASGDSDIL